MGNGISAEVRFIEYTGGNAFYRRCTAGESELVPCGVREVCALSLAAGFRPDLPGWLPVLAGRVFHELHMMEHGGSGIRRMNVACEPERSKSKSSGVQGAFRFLTFQSHRLEPRHRVDAASAETLFGGRCLGIDTPPIYRPAIARYCQSYWPLINAISSLAAHSRRSLPVKAAAIKGGNWSGVHANTGQPRLAMSPA